MKRHGIQIGKVIRFPGHRRMSGVGTYIVASAGRHKVTLFSPETGPFTVTRREFLKRGYTWLFCRDESWKFFADESQMSKYREEVAAVGLQVSEAFKVFLTRKGWRKPVKFNGLEFAYEVVSQPSVIESLAMPRKRKYHAGIDSNAQAPSI